MPVAEASARSSEYSVPGGGAAGSCAARPPSLLHAHRDPVNYSLSAFSQITSRGFLPRENARGARPLFVYIHRLARIGRLIFNASLWTLLIECELSLSSLLHFSHYLLFSFLPIYCNTVIAIYIKKYAL